MDESQIGRRIEELTGRTPRGRVRVFSDTSGFMGITAGDVIRMGERHYYVYGEATEGRFGLDEQPKLWVKRALELETGRRKVLKLAFFESFTMRVGDVPVECFRSPRKEARILETTRDDPCFMRGEAREDDAGNLVRILDRINGVSIYEHVHRRRVDHETYFHEEFPRLFASVLEAVRAIGRLHAAGELHGDIRNDHLWLDRDTGVARWIDFDYAYEWTENPWGVDLYGLGNVLLLAAGRDFYTLRSRDACLPGGVAGTVCLEPEDFSLFFGHRVMNLRKLFPYVPESLNRVLMRFAHKVEVLYTSVDEMIAELEACRPDLGIEENA
ncbi:MAG: serine/threonine protein kinase [Gemmatimonadota bacterium]